MGVVHPHHLPTQPGQIVHQAGVSAIDMSDAVDVRSTLGNQSGKN